MIYLLFFIIGIVCYEWIFPLIDSFVQLLGIRIEEKKNIVAERIKKIQSSTEERTPAIGFQWVDDEEEGDEEEYD